MFEYVDVHQKPQQLSLEKGSLCFTYCQVPIVYSLAAENRLTIVHKNGETTTSHDLEVDKNDSRKVFDRTGEIVQIKVHLELSLLK
jgi:hypothetical protein